MVIANDTVETGDVELIDINSNLDKATMEDQASTTIDEENTENAKNENTNVDVSKDNKKVMVWILKNVAYYRTFILKAVLSHFVQNS